MKHLMWLWLAPIVLLAACGTTTDKGPFKISCSIANTDASVAAVTFTNTTPHSQVLGRYRVTFYSDPLAQNEIGHKVRDFTAQRVFVGEQEYTWHTRVPAKVAAQRPESCQVTDMSQTA